MEGTGGSRVVRTFGGVMNAIDDTICALSTPAGLGALGVVRITGPEALGCTRGVFRTPSGALLEEQPERKAVFGQISDPEGGVLDEAVGVYFRGPRSFTGEDTVEFSCHGSPYILQRLLDSLTDAGCRLAEPGEFSRRAFLNGRVDLAQAEAIGDLIAAENAAMHRLAMRQMRGGFSSELQRLRTELIDFAALIELELDFVEEDVEFAHRERLRGLLDRLKQEIGALVDSFRTGSALREGIPVAIVGRPNAGKSTLLNVLLGEQRALVSDIPGTTRDTVEEVLVIGGMKFRFIDTAGLRATVDVVEAMGIARTLEKATSAAVLVYLIDVREAPEQDLQGLLDVEALVGATPVLVALNKVDAADPARWTSALGGRTAVALSAKTGLGLDTLTEQLVTLAQTDLDTQAQVVVSNARHVTELRLALEALHAVSRGLDTGLSGEFLAQDLRLSLYHLGRITGEVTSEDLLGSIFSRFCIGK